MSTPVHIWVCDYAAVGADGTSTIIRGGIEKLGSATLPVNALVWVYVEIEPGSLPVGDHKVHLSIVKSEMGLFQVNGSLKITEPQQRSRFAMPVTCSVQSYGEMKVLVEVGSLNGERVLVVQPVESVVPVQSAAGGSS